MSDLIIGIDLGTTNSLVAFCDAHGPRIIASPDGQTSLPSVVYINPVTGALDVGSGPRARAVEKAMETVFSVKRLMGRGIEDVRGEMAYLPYRVVRHEESQGSDDRDQRSDDGGRRSQSPCLRSEISNPQSPISNPHSSLVDVQVGAHRRTPQQISAAILAELKRWAEAHFRKPVRRAVITVPAYFDDAQRQATRDAAAIAGLEALRIVNEPTAAALAYGLDRSEDATIAVYDFGGGTFDISILRVQKGVFRVLATHGDTHLGGDDMDRVLMRLFEKEIKAQFGADLEFDVSTQQALRGFAEAVKVQLSAQPVATVEIGIGNGRTYRRELKREQFEELMAPLVGKTLDCCASALMEAKMSPGDVQRVVMVGGATYIPAIRRAVGQFFNTEVYTAIDPMQTVALGAAIQAMILAGRKRDALLLDIVPLTLGIETMGGAQTKLIAKGTHIPCHAATMFTTFVDGQTSVKVHVVQGERELVKDCRSLGEFVLSGLPPMPAGIPRIAISLLVDANGILNISAREERSDVSAAIQVIPSYGLTPKEVARIIREGLEHRNEDLLDHWLVDLHNQICSDAAAIEKALTTVGDGIDEAYRQELIGLVEAVRGMLEWNDCEKIARALHYLNQKSTRLAEVAMAKALREA